MMHDHEKSDYAIVAGKPTNKAAATAAEPRAGTERSADEQSTHRTLSRDRVTQTLGPVRQNRRRQLLELAEAMGRAAEAVAPSSSIRTDVGCPVAQVNDLSRSLTAFDPLSTLVVVVEMSKAELAGERRCSRR